MFSAYSYYCLITLPQLNWVTFGSIR